MNKQGSCESVVGEEIEIEFEGEGRLPDSWMWPKSVRCSKLVEGFAVNDPGRNIKARVCPINGGECPYFDAVTVRLKDGRLEIDE